MREQVKNKLKVAIPYSIHELLEIPIRLTNKDSQASWQPTGTDGQKIGNLQQCTQPILKAGFKA